MAGTDGDRRLRVLAAALAVVLGAFVLQGLATGLIWAGPRTRYLDRLAQPALYWAWVALGVLACGYFVAAARGWVATRRGAADLVAERTRRQRGGTLFGLAGAATLAWFWWAERPATGLDPGHTVLGLGVLGLTGYVLALAPATAPLALRLGGGVLMAGAVVAAWLV